MIASPILPEKLFINTGISVSLWFLNKDKKKNNTKNIGNILFMDARSLAKQDPNKRTQNILDNEAIETIENEYHDWYFSEDYTPKENFSINLPIEDVLENNGNLNPSRYIKVQKSIEQNKDNLDKIIKYFKEYESLVNKQKKLDLEITKVIQRIFREGND